MKAAILLAAAIVTAVPVTVVTVPTSAEAQVLAGRNAARRSAPRPTGLGERDRRVLEDAQDRVFEHESAIATLTAITTGGGVLTEAQTRELADLQRRLADDQRTIERLEAKRERLGG